MTTSPQLVLSRTFDAPRDLVFAVCTDAKHLTHWWGPKGCTVEIVALDVRPGGQMHYRMQFNGGEMWGLWVFREVTPPEKLEFVSSFSDAEGKITRAPFDESWPLETLSTFSFSEQDGKTTLSLHGVPLNATEAEVATFGAGIPSMQGGWGGTLDALGEYLGSLR